MNKKNLLLTTLVLTSLSFPVLAVDNTTGTGNGIAYGTNSNAVNTQDIAVGQSSKVENYVGQNGSVAIGYKSHVENMSGGVEASVGMGQTNYSGNMWSSARIPADPSKMVGSVAIGNNTYARTGSTMIGSHNYRGELGDVTIDTDHDGTRAASLNAYSTTVGANSFSNGAFTTNTGTYNIISSDYTGGRFSTPVKNFAATVNGSFNSVESYDSWSSTAGVANTVMGTANRVSDSNGALVYGAGNEITNSRTRIDNLNAENVASAKEFANKLRESIISSNGGGSTMAIGGGNKADNTRSTAIIGVNNSVTGVNGNAATNNFVAGTNHKLNNVNNGVFIGVADKDNTTSNVTNTVSIGTKNVVSGDQTIAMGTEAKATANGAMAIGYKVQATGRDAIAIGGNQKEPGDYVDVPTTIASGRQSIAMGYRAISEGNLSTAIGYGAHTEGATSVAIGTGSATTADDGTAVGNGAMARSARASAYGTSSRADGENSVAIGYYSDATAANSVAIGSYTAIDESAENTVVIGGSSRDFFTAKNATAVGANTYVYENGGVALGANSRAGEAVSTSSAVINGHVYNFAGGHASSTVSVGVANGMVDGDGNPVEETYRTVTNVAAGRINAESTDAINGSQLHSVIQEMSSVASDTLTKANNYTDNQVNKVGAASAALAALHPLEFNKDYKWQFATGFGNYGNKTAVALGAFYQPNENILLSLGTTLDGHNNMVNGGATFRFGHNSEMNTDKQVATDVKVKELENRLKVMEEKYNELLQNQNK